MSGFNVEAEQLRSHAGNIDKIKQRLAKVKSASAHITADAQAYPLSRPFTGVSVGDHRDTVAVNPECRLPDARGEESNVAQTL